MYHTITTIITRGFLNFTRVYFGTGEYDDNSNAVVALIGLSFLSHKNNPPVSLTSGLFL
mgnify:CR=1 FL=1